jgi:hypothetical protein
MCYVQSPDALSLHPRHELAGGYDCEAEAPPLHLRDCEQVGIAGDDELCLPCQRSRKEDVVIWVATRDWPRAEADVGGGVPLCQPLAKSTHDCIIDLEAAKHFDIFGYDLFGHDQLDAARVAPEPEDLARVAERAVRLR